MSNTLNRSVLLLAVATVVPTSFGSACGAEMPPATSAEVMLANLEGASGARLGVYALNTDDGSQIRHRADERFPLCSTFKVILASAILERSAQDGGLMRQRIRFAKRDLVAYSPVSKEHLDDGMTVAELCAAAIQHSDNTAANLLMKHLGGPSAVTAFARSIGNNEFRLDRWETELNTAIPGDSRDTATPSAMGHSLQSLVLGDALPFPQRNQLDEWLRGNTTGAKRIRAAAPAGWQVGDKTGSGGYGTANDIAVLWPPGRKPIVLAIYHTRKEADAKSRDEIIAAAAQIVINAFAAPRVAPAKPPEARPSP